MSSISRAARSALVVLAGLVGIVGASSVASAQRSQVRIGRAGSPPPQPSSTVPYPGATVTIDPRFAVPPGQFLGNRRQHQRRNDGFSNGGFFPPVVYPYAYGSAGGVYDTNGRPLYTGYETQAPTQQYPASPYPASPRYNDFPVATPDLSGSPYVVIEGGTMIVDFGNGDRRAVPACAVVEAASTPDGKPRTLFYQPGYQLVLRSGQRGQVLGRPTAGARICYTNDAYGRVVLDY